MCLYVVISSQTIILQITAFWIISFHIATF